MVIVNLKSKAAMAQDLLSACTSFELRGPKAAALIDIRGVNVEVLCQENDWTEVVAGRPMTDNRTDKISDLIPPARVRMEEIFSGFAERVKAAGSDTNVSPIKGPRM